MKAWGRSRARPSRFAPGLRLDGRARLTSRSGSRRRLSPAPHGHTTRGNTFSFLQPQRGGSRPQNRDRRGRLPGFLRHTWKPSTGEGRAGRPPARPVITQPPEAPGGPPPPHPRQRGPTLPRRATPGRSPPSGPESPWYHMVRAQVPQRRLPRPRPVLLCPQWTERQLALGAQGLLWPSQTPAPQVNTQPARAPA